MYSFWVRYSLIIYILIFSYCLIRIYILDKNDQISLRKFAWFVSRQSLEFKVLSDIAIDFSYIYYLSALIVSYTIVMYQIIET